MAEELCSHTQRLRASVLIDQEVYEQVPPSFPSLALFLALFVLLLLLLLLLLSLFTLN